ncbi:probable serine/threonine-protein kinase pats1 [Mytilus edulis]|uniref:probable serine/threonine-protein kinase pats1 n=1 Tax=Mytilus edulis TaxID=6550 RepID=UPI0039EFD4A9
MMERSKGNLHDKDEYANLLLWDFAGDEEFYNTHQTFLSQNAIYLVVTKPNETDDKNAQGMFQLWMNSIHCYCRLDDKQNRPDSFTAKIDENATKHNTNILDPPVIPVGSRSHKDKVRHSKKEKIEIECIRGLKSYVKDVLDDACGHIRSEYFISNTKDDDGVFHKMKQDIFNLARGMQSWNKEYPLKFIQLEKCLQEKKMELLIPINTFKELTKISLETAMPRNDEELMLFLKFHHEIRAIVYFADLPNFIILDTQWLSDAFKCIVTPTKFQFNVSRHTMKEKLDDLNFRGISYTEVLEDIFKHEKNILYQHGQHKDDILNIMEKFDIIIPATRDSVDSQPCYYVPCMDKLKPEYDIYKLFNVTYNTCKKSTWLCFQF